MIYDITIGTHKQETPNYLANFVLFIYSLQLEPFFDLE